MLLLASFPATPSLRGQTGRTGPRSPAPLGGAGNVGHPHQDRGETPQPAGMRRRPRPHTSCGHGSRPLVPHSTSPARLSVRRRQRKRGTCAGASGEQGEGRPVPWPPNPAKEARGLLDAKLRRRWEAMAQVSPAGPPVQDLCHIMRSPARLWLQAEAHTAAHHGAVTPGGQRHPREGCADDRVTHILPLRAADRYPVQPSHRGSIPTATGKRRPCGCPPGEDTLGPEGASLL
jgi:hypothetical protein